MEHYTLLEKRGRIIISAKEGYRLDFGDGKYPVTRIGATAENISCVKTITEEEYKQIIAAEEHLKEVQTEHDY